MSETAVDINGMWEHYLKTKEQSTRDELLLHYVGLVQSIVRRMMPTYQGKVEYDDLISCGVLGLIDAVDKFDPAQGVQFGSYASVRIRGEIIDQMRKSDWAPSSLRRKINTMQKTFEALEKTLQRPPTDDEVAKHMQIKPQDVRAMLEKSYIFNLMHFEDALGEAQAAALPRSENRDENPEQAIEGKEMREVLTDMIGNLSEKERVIISLYYYEEMTLKEIAQVIGVTESRISQIHSKILIKLRGQMDRTFER